MRRFCLFLVAALYIPSAAAQVPRWEFAHRQMGTLIRLVFYAETDTSMANALARRIFDEVDTLNSVMSDYLPDSELNRLCARAGSGDTIRVSPDLYKILEISEKYSRLTEGAFDVTIGPLTRLWRRARSLGEFPDSARLAEAKNRTDYRQIRLVAPNRVYLPRAGIQIDLGGIAQGFTADRCLERLREAGIVTTLVDVGGDIALGAPPPGEPGWTIEMPDKTTRKLAHTGVTTSGSTYKHLEYNGLRYSHIIDPRTGMGLTHRILVSVEAPDAVTADALATALSISGKAGWERLRVHFPVIRVWLTEEK